MEKLYNLISDKRVVLVGPSGHLVGKGIGSVINSCDVVCRVNDILPFGYEIDYGDRTDVVFYNCSSRSLKWFEEKTDRYKDINKIKLVVCPTIKADHAWKDSVVSNFESINKYNLDFLWIGKDKYDEYSRLVGVEPNAGIISMMMLLECFPRELFITGFSFFAEGVKYDQVYYSDHVEAKFRESDYNPWLGHQMPPQIKFFREVVLSRYMNIIKIDSYLDNSLKLNYINVVGI